MTYFRTRQIGRGAFPCGWPSGLAWCWRRVAMASPTPGVPSTMTMVDLPPWPETLMSLDQASPSATPFVMQQATESAHAGT